MRDESDSLDPAISVVIPTRDRWRAITRFALPSTGRQAGVRHETIIVDDGSETRPDEDQAAAIERSGARVARLERNAGVASARNAGIKLARGEWVALLDDDDEWAPEKLEKVVGQAESEGADFGYSSVLLIDAERRPRLTVKAIAPHELRAEITRSNGVFAIASNIVVRRGLLDAIGGFDEEFSSAADWELLVRLVGAGKGAAVGEALVAYRASGWMYRDEALHRADLKRLSQKHSHVAIDWRSFDRTVALSLHRHGFRRRAARRYLDAAFRHRDARSLALAGLTPIDRAWIDRIRSGPAPPTPAWLRGSPPQPRSA